jgi:hypothetical protein
LHRLPAHEVPQDVLDEALVHAAQNERPGDPAIIAVRDFGSHPIVWGQ